MDEMYTHKWQLEAKHKQWTDFDKKASNKTEESYLLKKSDIVVGMNNSDWMIDFIAMKATNINSKKTRNIRRVPHGY